MNPATPHVALLNVGDELVAGRIVNTGGAVLARALDDAGFSVAVIECVPDRIDRIVEMLHRQVAAVDVVVLTGGLGPTPDDLTREAMAEASGAELVTDPGLLEEVIRRTRGLAPEANEKQAAIPAGATTFRNPVGVAAAIRIEMSGVPVYSLPGVPSEMKALLHDALLPDLQQRFPHVTGAEQAVVRASGIAEAVLVERLGELLDRGGAPEVGVTVADGIITITASGPGAGERAHAVKERLGDDVCAYGSLSLAGGVVQSLRERGAHLAVGESLTGGLLASAVVAIPGASQVFNGGVVAYVPELKHLLLGVPLDVIQEHGVVSETVARAMARGARERLGAEYGLATTGAAGPEPEQDGTLPGSGFVALAGPDGVETVRAVRSGGDRDAVRRRFVTAALDLLRRALV